MDDNLLSRAAIISEVNKIVTRTFMSRRLVMVQKLVAKDKSSTCAETFRQLPEDPT